MKPAISFRCIHIHPDCGSLKVSADGSGLVCDGGHFYPYAQGTTIPIFVDAPAGTSEYSVANGAEIHDNASSVAVCDLRHGRGHAARQPHLAPCLVLSQACRSLSRALARGTTSPLHRRTHGRPWGRFTPWTSQARCSSLALLAMARLWLERASTSSFQSATRLSCPTEIRLSMRPITVAASTCSPTSARESQR